MFELLKRYRSTVIIIAILLIGLLAYQFFIAGSENDPLLAVSGAGDISGAVVGRESVRILDQLNDLDLSGDILTSEVFQSLVDYRQEIFSQPAGRNNPFEPIGTDEPYTGQPVDVETILQEIEQ